MSLLRKASTSLRRMRRGSDPPPVSRDVQPSKPIRYTQSSENTQLNQVQQLINRQTKSEIQTDSISEEPGHTPFADHYNMSAAAPKPVRPESVSFTTTPAIDSPRKPSSLKIQEPNQPSPTTEDSSTVVPAQLTTVVSSAVTPPAHIRRRSQISPPPPSRYKKRVGFDTFTNKDATRYSLTLKSKHAEYVYNRHSRTFLIGSDTSDYSDYALDWLLESLVEDGDEIVALRVVEPESMFGFSVDDYRVEATKLLDSVIAKNNALGSGSKHISVIVEYATGKIQDYIQHTIYMYQPDSLIVGSRGRQLGIQALMPGSISKYCLQYSPVPVVVVRPDPKRAKKKKKRLADPGRRAYIDLLEKCGENVPDDSTGMHVAWPMLLTSGQSDLAEPVEVVPLKDRTISLDVPMQRERSSSGISTGEGSAVDSPSPGGSKRIFFQRRVSNSSSKSGLSDS
ncbi:hypothetical protein G7K_5024-t1 [Saitoella complicata NRRL Y-17804]|uniref:UspA domain-containing protein n=2 Tax=Saitoella complicata (strain BCRC 22490 / CBS 7301 / JCM 7358 / NBRC 10748 / NRRL Y-17804) TaxID=698492 RepID=A0A0E9NNC7_SAICN|nr:hypothetical protein G7K_5024-t1 [Saitoella complicata NRRL Y-17804]